MRKTFVEMRGFTARVKTLLSDDEYRALQTELMDNPQKGAVMPGCGGLRKVRVGSSVRGKGKRGGARVIYLDIPEAERVDMIAIYGKNEQDDLTAAQKRDLKQLADVVRKEAVAAFKRRRRSDG